tara:strand:- start:3288 stop:3587 length:300 start_codon:yes stop_codon:yes gene_type:complete
METILETISVASEELDEIPLYEIIIETIDSQEDEIIFEAILEWDRDLRLEIFPLIESINPPNPNAREFYGECLIYYFFRELQIYLGFNINTHLSDNGKS